MFLMLFMCGTPIGPASQMLTNTICLYTPIYTTTACTSTSSICCFCCRLQFKAFQAAAQRAMSAAGSIGLQPITLPQQQQQQHSPDHTPPTTPQPSPHKPHPSPSSSSSSKARRPNAVAGSPGGGGGAELLLEGVTPGGDIRSLCEVPFLLTTEAKSNILRVRNGKRGLVAREGRSTSGIKQLCELRF